MTHILDNREDVRSRADVFYHRLDELLTASRCSSSWTKAGSLLQDPVFSDYIVDKR